MCRHPNRPPGTRSLFLGSGTADVWGGQIVVIDHDVGGLDRQCTFNSAASSSAKLLSVHA